MPPSKVTQTSSLTEFSSTDGHPVTAITLELEEDTAIETVLPCVTGPKIRAPLSDSSYGKVTGTANVVGKARLIIPLVFEFEIYKSRLLMPIKRFSSGSPSTYPPTINSRKKLSSG